MMMAGQCSYWAMRTDRNNSNLILEELRQGRLRQGWGYAECQDLRFIKEKLENGGKFTPEERDAWRNCLMLGDKDGIQIGDIILLPNLPRPSEFLLVEVDGPYRFEPFKLDSKSDINGLGQDYGHILPVKKTPKQNPILLARR